MINRIIPAPAKALVIADCPTGKNGYTNYALARYVKLTARLSRNPDVQTAPDINYSVSIKISAGETY